MTSFRSFTMLAMAITGILSVACGSATPTPRREPTARVAPPPPAVPPIPAGYHAITPSIVVTDVPAALAFYERAFGATETMRLTARSGRTIHAEMQIGDSFVLVEPENTEHGARAPISAGGASGALYVYVEDVDAALARAVEAGGELVMPATDMFWGDRFGNVRDPNGHTWSLATHTLDLSPAQVRVRGEAHTNAMLTGGALPTFAGGNPATSWRPEGYPVVTALLVVDGPEVLDFYAAALDAEVTGRMLMPDGSLMHGEIRLGDSVVMFAGESPAMPTDRTPTHLGASTLSLMHYVPDADASFARAIGAGGTTAMPVGDTFWGDRYGAFSDPAGQVWAIATHVREVSADELTAAVASM